jgi:beta-alanine degradation protein BauB
MRGFAAGVAVGAAMMGAAGLGPVLRPQAAVASEPPPAAAASRKVVLENARVRVKDVTFAPGASPMHTHELAHVGVILTAGTLVFTEPGKPAEKVAFDAGSVGFREAGVTHQVTNPGPGPMRVIEVELK